MALLEHKFIGEESWFITPDGRPLKINTHHAEYVYEHPREFGFTPRSFKNVDWTELVDLVMQRGWIRIFFTHNDISVTYWGKHNRQAAVFGLATVLRERMQGIAEPLERGKVGMEERSSDYFEVFDIRDFMTREGLSKVAGIFEGLAGMDKELGKLSDAIQLMWG